jgi:hypothetical protein
VACIAEPHTMHGASHPAGFRSIHEQPGVKHCTKSWEANERDWQFGENVDIGMSQGLRREGNARINKVLAIRAGVAKIIEKLHISRYFESPQTDHHKAENACCIDYTDTWSSKQVHYHLIYTSCSILNFSSNKCIPHM